MKHQKYTIHFVTLCISGFLYSGLVAAEDTPPSGPKSAAYQVATVVDASASGFALQSAQYPSNYILVKASKPTTQEVCEARCKKAYRRCYGQGNRPGTPEVHGGEPCIETQTRCLRACAM